MMMMPAEQAAGAAATSAVTGGNESVARLATELERLEASFRAALERAVKPVPVRREALIEAKTVLVGEVQEPPFANAADHARSTNGSPATAPTLRSG